MEQRMIRALAAAWDTGHPIALDTQEVLASLLNAYEDTKTRFRLNHTTFVDVQEYLLRIAHYLEIEDAYLAAIASMDAPEIAP